MPKEKVPEDQPKSTCQIDFHRLESLQIMNIASKELRSSYLSAAIQADGNCSDDFADVVTEEVSLTRLFEALSSGYTRAIFNGAEGVRFYDDGDAVLPLLLSVYHDCENAEGWQLIDKAEADLPTTLGCIRYEIIDAIGEARLCSLEVLELLSEALRKDEDDVHFFVLPTLTKLGSLAGLLIDDVREYLNGLAQRDLHPISKIHLKDLAIEALLALTI